ncbi:hypothetical protein BKA80DRAFT_259235 [Phyllosticta citrichinensis]
MPRPCTSTAGLGVTQQSSTPGQHMSRALDPRYSSASGRGEPLSPPWSHPCTCSPGPGLLPR